MNLDALRHLPWWGWVLVVGGAAGMVYLFWRFRQQAGATSGAASAPGGQQLPSNIDPLTGVPYSIESATNPATGLPAYYGGPGTGNGNGNGTQSGGLDSAEQAALLNQWEQFGKQGPAQQQAANAFFGQWEQQQGITAGTPWGQLSNTQQQQALQAFSNFEAQYPSPNAKGSSAPADPRMPPAASVVMTPWPQPDPTLYSVYLRHGRGQSWPTWQRMVMDHPANKGMRPDGRIYPWQRVYIP